MKLRVAWISAVFASAVPSALAGHSGPPAFAGSQATGRRLALVVSNENYSLAPLVNAGRDASTVAGVLREIGFGVTTVADATRAGFARTLGRFAADLKVEDTVVFFFAGYAGQVDGDNYLLPVDFGTDASDTAIRLGANGLADIQRAFRGTHASILILDACRTAPILASRQGVVGLGPMEGPGSLVIFETSPNQLVEAERGPTTGLFAIQLARVLRMPGLSVRNASFQVRQLVSELSAGRQVPVVYDQLLDDFMLTPTEATQRVPSQELPQTVGELWSVLQNTQDIATLQAFVRRYPNGQFRSQAEARIRTLAPEVVPLSTAWPATDLPAQVVVRAKKAIVRASAQAPGSRIADVSAGDVLDVAGREQNDFIVMLTPDANGFRRIGYVASAEVEPQNVAQVTRYVTRSKFPNERINIAVGYSVMFRRGAITNSCALSNYLSVSPNPPPCPTTLQRMLAGTSFTVSAKVLPFLGVVGEVTGNFDRGPTLYSDGSSYTTFLGGARVGMSDRWRVQPFVQYLAGGSIAGGLPYSYGDYLFQLGTGADFRLTRRFRLRGQTDAVLVGHSVTHVSAVRFGLSGVFRLGSR